MDRLQERVDLLRWLLPATAFIVVLLHQIVEHTWLRGLPWAHHFATQVVFYGLAGPLVVWLMLTWIARSVAARERAMDQLAALRSFSRRLATTPDEQILDTVVQFPAEIIDAVGSSLMLFHDRSGVASVEATWGWAQDDVDVLRRQVDRQAAYARCHGCQALRATLTEKCPALPAALIESEGIGSVICLPLGRGDETIGRLNVYLSTEDSPAEDKLHLLNAMAAEAAPAIEAARLRSRELSTLYQVDRAVRRRLGNLDGLLRKILHDTVDASQADGGAILLCGEPGEPLTVHAATPDSFAVDDTQALGSLLADRRSPIQITELGAAKGEADTGAAVGVPMTVDDEVVGVLYIAHQDPSSLSQRQVQLLSAVASQTALIVQNARFYAQLESHAILEERGRLAREMHDGLAQGLGYLNLKAQQALRRLRQERWDEAETEVAEIRSIVQDLYTEVRAAIDGLRMPFDPDRPFGANLAAYVDGISQRAEFPIQLEIEDPALDLPPTTATQVLRVVQEGLNNVVKHSGASRAAVKIAEKRSGLHISIQDDGRGFDPARVSGARRDLVPPRLGLQIMRERARELGGQLDLRSDAEQGTTITLRLPHSVFQPVLSVPERAEGL